MKRTKTLFNLLLILVSLTSCGRQRAISAKAKQTETFQAQAPTTTLPASPTPEQCPNFQVGLSVVSGQGPLLADRPIRFRLSAAGCLGRYRTEEGETFEGSMEFSVTFPSPGEKTVRRQVVALSPTTGGILATNSANLSIPIAEPPTEVVLPAAPSCTLVKLSGFNPPLQPAAAFEVRTVGLVTRALVNGLAYHSGPILVPPGPNGMISVVAKVENPGGQGICGFDVMIPACSLAGTINEPKSATLFIGLFGEISQVHLNDSPVPLPLPRPSSVSKVLTFSSPGAQTVRARVSGPAGDHGECTLPITVWDRFAGVSKAASEKEAPNPVSMDFLIGYQTSGQSSFLLGGGALRNYGQWTVVKGASTEAIHTGVASLAYKACPANSIVTGIQGKDGLDYWSGLYCAPLLPSFQLYDESTVHVPWGEGSHGHCGAGKVLRAISFQWGPDYGPWKARLELTCASIKTFK